MSRPNKNLRVKSFVTTRNSDGSWIDSYVFSDGSAWTESMCNGWACQWAPIDSRNDEPEESSKALTAKKANSIAEARLSQCNDTFLATARLRDECCDRAERAESALAEAQERALRFEKLLKEEEARREVEPVIELKRLLETLYEITLAEHSPLANSAYWLIKMYSDAKGIGIGTTAAQRRPYKLQ